MGVAVKSTSCIDCLRRACNQFSVSAPVISTGWSACLSSGGVGGVKASGRVNLNILVNVLVVIRKVIIIALISHPNIVK